jgi:dihydroorotase
VQDALLVLLDMSKDGVLGLTDIVTKTAHNPSKRFRVKDRGFLREGYHADLVLVDLSKNTEVTSGRVLSRCGWSPFEGTTFRSRITRTWVNGSLAFDGDRVIEHGAAMRLEFDRPKNRG